MSKHSTLYHFYKNKQRLYKIQMHSKKDCIIKFQVKRNMQWGDSVLGAKSQLNYLF